MTINTVCYENEYFKISHCGDCFIAGHLIIHPKQTTSTLFAMSPEAQEQLGKTLAVAHSIIANVIQPERIYTLSFCELLPAIHFHLFPRTRSLLDIYNFENNIKEEGANGALIFDWARKRYKDSPTENYAEHIQKLNEQFQRLQ